MQLYTSDFWGDALVRRMPTQVALNYLGLLMALWDTGPLEDPEAELAIMGAPEGAWGWIEACLVQLEDGNWTQPRLERDRSGVAKSKGKRVEAGKRSGAARRAKKAASGTMNEHCSINAQAMPEQPITITRTIPTQPEKKGGAFAPHKEAPVADASGLSPEKKIQQRKPTLAQVRSSVKQHLALSTLPAFGEAMEAWHAALGARKRWASLDALSRRLRWLEQRPDDALSLVRIATAERWTDPVHALKVLEQDRGRDPRRPQSPHLS